MPLTTIIHCRSNNRNDPTSGMRGTNYVPLIESGVIRMTFPESPRSRSQRYVTAETLPRT
ncbi:MAG: Fic family protein [Akkermansia muciniphila]